MDVEVVALGLITMVAIGVAMGLLSSVGVDMGVKEKFDELFDSAAESITPGSSYNICQDYDDELISQRDFQTLLQAAYRGDCGNFSMTLQLSFSLTKDDISAMLETLEIAKNGEHVFYRKDLETLGIGAIIVKGNPGIYPLKMWDRVDLEYRGEPTGDIILTVTEEGCDPYDANCEVMCSYMPDVCDPYCYNDGVGEDTVCDIDCVDLNGDGVIDVLDLDGICDPDCYNDYIDPERAYDLDCVDQNKKIFDGICDPDSNGVLDGICDPDCADPDNNKSKTICDPDCDGLITNSGNPRGLLDAACYVCDGDCNGFCSMICERDEDPDCPKGFKGFENLTECCGNGKCSSISGENCEDCPTDCPSASTTCNDLGGVCCPDAQTDTYGCSTRFGLSEGEQCSCDSQCLGDYMCASGHCCLQGSFWSPSEEKCINQTDVLIVALRGELEGVYGDSEIESLEKKIKKYQEVLVGDDLGSQFIYLDDSSTADIVPGGKYVTSTSSASNIRETLKPLQNTLENKYLVIIGGYGRFVQATVGTVDSYTMYSDAYYGDTDGDGKYLMEVAVGRFPDPTQGDLDVILEALDTAIEIHEAGGVSLEDHMAPIMGCGGIDDRNWNSGKCFCSDIFGSSCQACGSCCGNIGYSSISGRDFVMVLAHGPGEAQEDFYWGGGLNVGTGLMSAIDVSDTVWMTMACGGGHLKLKSVTGDSMAMSFLENGGAVFIGSTNVNLGALGPCYTFGGDNAIGSLYAEIASRFSEGVTIGEAYLGGKNAYYPKYNCEYGQAYHYHINCLYGDPTLKIKEMWS